MTHHIFQKSSSNNEVLPFCTMIQVVQWNIILFMWLLRTTCGNKSTHKKSVDFKSWKALGGRSRHTTTFSTAFQTYSISLDSSDVHLLKKIIDKLCSVQPFIIFHKIRLPGKVLHMIQGSHSYTIIWLQHAHRRRAIRLTNTVPSQTKFSRPPK